MQRFTPIIFLPDRPIWPLLKLGWALGNLAPLLNNFFLRIFPDEQLKMAFLSFASYPVFLNHSVPYSVIPDKFLNNLSWLLSVPVDKYTWHIQINSCYKKHVLFLAAHLWNYPGLPISFNTMCGQGQEKRNNNFPTQLFSLFLFPPLPNLLPTPFVPPVSIWPLFGIPVKRRICAVYFCVWKCFFGYETDFIGSIWNWWIIFHK